MVDRPALLGMTAALVGRVLFLDLRRIHEGDREEIGRRGRCQDRSREAVVDEARQKAAVIEMGVGEEDEIQVRRRDRERVPVAAEERPFLIEPAVDQAAQAIGLDEIRGPRDLSRRPQESQLHRVAQ
jgi:hypothetical protein